MNLQVIEKQILISDGSLDVVDIFPTIQGEGPFVGRPAVFVRLAGCNLQCPECDTDYTSNRKLLSEEEIVKTIVEVAPPKCGLVVLTGGEPMRQQLAPFVHAVRRKGFHVQVETNGTLCDKTIGKYGLWGSTTIVCSPKTPKLNEDLFPNITHFKYVVTNGEVDPADGLPTSSLGMSGKPARPPEWFFESFRDKIYVQPCDSKNATVNDWNIKEAIKSCMQFGYTLCLQIHKIIGLP